MVMAQLIRAIYEQGLLRPLDPVNLTDGQEIRLALLSEREQIRFALADLLAPPGATLLAPINEGALAARLDVDLAGSVSVSDAILEERREGP